MGSERIPDEKMRDTEAWRRVFESFPAHPCEDCGRGYGAMLSGARCDCGGLIGFAPLSERSSRADEVLSHMERAVAQSIAERLRERHREIYVPSRTHSGYTEAAAYIEREFASTQKREGAR